MSNSNKKYRAFLPLKILVFIFILVLSFVVGTGKVHASIVSSPSNLLALIAECFPAGTKISLDDGTRVNIEDVQSGNKVLSQDAKGNRSPSTVEELLQLKSYNMCDIHYTDGESLKITNPHPLYTQYGWKAIDTEAAIFHNPGLSITQLLPGDFVAKEDGSWAQISGISCSKGDFKVYNLSVDNNHNYFAEGFLAHNKCSGCHCDNSCTSDPKPPPESCFPAGTSVLMSTGEKKNIEEVKAGDRVISQSENGQKSVSIVTGVETPIRESMCRVNFSNGEKLELTSEHPMFTNEGWKAINPNATLKENDNIPVTALLVGDKIAGSDGTYAQVSSIACRSEKIQTYNLLLDNGAHTYFADGFLAHNKIDPNPPPMPPPPPPPPPPPGPERPAEGTCNTSGCTYGGVFFPDGTPIYGQFANGNDWCYLAGGGDCGGGGGGDGGIPVCNPDNWNAWSACSVSCGTGTQTSMNECGTTRSQACEGGLCTPVGWHDSSSCLASTGWACDQDNYNQAMTIQFYEGGPAGAGGINIGSTVANITREAAVGALCGGNSAHGFSLTTPASLLDGQSHTLYAYAVNTPAGDNFLLNGSPKTISSCAVPWWQVEDSDIQSMGALSSNLPLGKYFGLNGPGGYAGVAAYADSTNLTTANASQIGWLAKSPWTSPKVFDYKFFANQIPSDVIPTTVDTTDVAASLTTGGEYKYGYYWYKYDGSASGPLTLPAVDFGNRRVILLVANADLNISGNVNLTDGSGFFLAIVGENENGEKGNINIEAGVGGGTSANPNIKGLYVADNLFNILSTGTGDDQNLVIRGSVAAYGGIQLPRDLGLTVNADQPAELFQYAPEQIMLFPSKLGSRKINWQEVAP